MSSITIYAGILWYGAGVVGTALAIWGLIYFARLFDITRKQLYIGLTGGFFLAAGNVSFYYFTSTHMVHYLYDDIFRYAELVALSILAICLVYFLLTGMRNIRKNYNLDIRGLWPREIKELKRAKDKK